MIGRCNSTLIYLNILICLHSWSITEKIPNSCNAMARKRLKTGSFHIKKIIISVDIHLLRSEQRLVSGEVEHGGGRVGWVKERTPFYEGERSS